MPGKHARLSPSDATRWGSCSGSVALDDRVRLKNEGELPDKSSRAADQGTLCHEYSYHKIMAPFVFATEAEWRVRKASELSEQIDETGIENAEVYIRYVHDFIKEYKSDDLDWNCETKFRLWYEPESSGTADFWAIDKVRRTLYVLDYKSGRMPVESYHNAQLAIYAIAAYDLLKAFNEIDTIKVAVLQPVVKHSADWWQFDREEMEHLRTQVDRSVREINNPLFAPHFSPGEKQCQWCRHAGSCVARAESLVEDIDPTFEVSEIDDDRALEIWGRARMHRNFLDALEERIREMDDDTRGNGGWKLVPGSRRISWENEEKAILALANSGIVLYDPPKLRSPASVRKELGDDGPLIGLIVESRNKPLLVQASDRREALTEEA